MRATLVSVGLLVVLGALVGCFHEMETMEGTGTIRYINLEGGFYGIEADDGQRLDPVNLSSQYRQNGLRVRFRVRMVDEVLTIHQWGTPVEILEIDVLTTSQS